MVTRLRSLAGGATAPYGSVPHDDARAIGRMTAIFTIGAGVIHVSAAADHDHLPVMLAGFIVVAVLQVGLGALLLWRRPSRELAVAGIALASFAVIAWLTSRTVGLDFLGIAHAEPIGVKDGVAVLFELVSIPGLVALAGDARRPASLPAPLRNRHALELVAAVALALYVPALLLEGGNHHTHEQLLAHSAGDGHRAGAADHGGRGAHADMPGLRVAAHRAGHDGGGSGSRGGGGHTSLAHDTASAHSGHSTLAVAGTHTHGVTPALAASHAHAAAAPIGAGTSHSDHPGASDGSSGGHPAGHPGASEGGSHPGAGAHPPGHYEPPPAPPPAEQPPTLTEQVSDEIDKLVP